MIGRIYNKVHSVLSNNIATRSNDKLLMLDIWELEGLRLSPEQRQAFMHVTSSETITRTRRKIQESGKFLANEQTAQARREAEYQVFNEVMSDQLAQQAISWIKD